MIDSLLLAHERLNDLGPGSPNDAARPALQAMQTTFVARAENRDFALACMAGLWLLHDFHDESHAISQDLDTIEGSYWHGILHRREPDYWNANYWFRRVNNHPIFAPLAIDAAALTRDAGTHQRGANGCFGKRPGIAPRSSIFAKWPRPTPTI